MLWAPTVSGREKNNHPPLAGVHQVTAAVKLTVIHTWFFQRLGVPHQPRHRLTVPVEDLHRQIVVLLLLHDPLLKLLLDTPDSPSTPAPAHELPAVTNTNLAHDCELQRQVLHLHKVLFIRPLAVAA